MTITTPKDWFQSKTLWLNVISLAVFIAGWVAENSGLLQLDPRAVVIAGGLVATGNFVLRLMTVAPIAGTPAAATLVPAEITVADSPPH